MDISINSGKYAKKEDIDILAKTLKEMADIMDENAVLVDKKIEMIFNSMTDVVGRIFGEYQSFNESWIEKALDEQYKDIYREELKKFKENLMERMRSVGDEIASEFEKSVR